MNPNEALQLYTALKLHFTTSYDFHKYQGKLKNRVGYTKRKDKWQIQRLAKHQDPMNLVISCLLKNVGAWVGDIVSTDGLKEYEKWKKRQDTLTDIFTQDLKQFEAKTMNEFAEAFKVIDHQHPKALRLYLGDKISLETLCVINRLTNFYPHWEKELFGDLMWRQIGQLIPKYSPFIKHNLNSFKGIIKFHFPN